MAETIIKGIITALNVREGDSSKGHWMRQECVMQPDGGGRPIHFQVNGADKIGVYGFQQGKQYVVRLYLESLEKTVRDGQLMWFDSFICGGVLTDMHIQYYNTAMYKLKDPQFIRNYQMAMRHYTTVQQPQTYSQPIAACPQPSQPQGYGNQYTGQQQPYNQPVQQMMGDQSDLPF